MAKRPRKKRIQPRRQTNWTLIGAIGGAAVIALFALLYLAIRPAPPVTATDLATYCAENEGACVAEGATDATVTIVEIADYGCPACATFNAQTAEPLHTAFVKTDQVRYLVVPFALRDETLPAAASALCAAEQELFAPYHDAMFAFQNDPRALTRDGLMVVAAGVGLEMDAFATCVDGRRYNQTIADNVAAAAAAGVRATPSFFIGAELLEGAQPFSVFRDRLNNLLSS